MGALELKSTLAVPLLDWSVLPRRALPDIIKSSDVTWVVASTAPVPHEVDTTEPPS